MRRLMPVVLVALVAIAIGIALLRSGPSVPDRSVLVLELGGALEEAPAVDSLDRFIARGPALPTLLLQLEKASVDERVVGVILHTRALELSYARIQELRDAISRVRAAQKPVVALLDLATLNATRELYLASAADEIYLVPGFLGPVAGIAGQYLHMAGLFDKLGVRVEYEAAGRYKSAPEMFANHKMSAPARRMMNQLLDDLFAQITRGIAEGRKLEPEAVRALIDQAPSTGDEYLKAGLADGVKDYDDLLDLEAFADAEELFWDTYIHVDPRDLDLRNGPEIALIFGQGSIIQSDAGSNPRTRYFAADAIGDALQAAADDDEVRAIVLRINSGGGSALASDQLWRKVRRVREEKPVVISMSDAAASGGYYVASAADAIVAEPATLTGSIGVFFLRPSLSGMFRKLNVDSEVIVRGRHASITVSDEPFTPAQRKRTRHFVQTLYQDFMQRISTGRDMEVDAIEKVAEGRVWLGENALGHGLVDELGGLYAAVKLAKAEAGLDPEIDPTRVVFPGPRTLGEQLRSVMQGKLFAGWVAAWIPFGLPDFFYDAAQLVEGEIAYLPPYWIDVY